MESWKLFAVCILTNFHLAIREVWTKVWVCFGAGQLSLCPCGTARYEEMVEEVGARQDMFVTGFQRTKGNLSQDLLFSFSAYLEPHTLEEKD